MWELYSRLPAHEYVVVAGDAPGSATFDRGHTLEIVRMRLDFDSWGALGWRRGGAYLNAYRRLAAIARNAHISSVHAACCLPEGFLALLMLRRLNIPYLVYLHGEELNVVSSSRELKWMTRRVLRGASLVIANSDNTTRLLTSGWPVPMSRIRVLPPGVDTARFRPAAFDPATRQRLGWDNRRVVLTVGRLQPRKGHAALIRCLPAIKKAVPDVLYAIVGDGLERESLGQLVDKLNLAAHVKFHGELAGDELPSLYQQCDLFVLPNREVAGDIEGFGIVLLEAQACGKPVIAGSSGGTKEAVGLPNSGRVIDCDNLELLKATVGELLGDAPGLRQMGVAAREWAVSHCDWRIRCTAARTAFSELEADKVPLAEATT